MSTDTEFPCKLTFDIPFPTGRHAAIALRALSVDNELSQLVKRCFEIVDSKALPRGDAEDYEDHANGDSFTSRGTVLRVKYVATTARMLRVATNGFLESLGVVVSTMEELDLDALALAGRDKMDGAQGVEPLDD